MIMGTSLRRSTFALVAGGACVLGTIRENTLGKLYEEVPVFRSIGIFTRCPTTAVGDRVSASTRELNGTRYFGAFRCIISVE